MSQAGRQGVWEVYYSTTSSQREKDIEDEISSAARVSAGYAISIGTILSALSLHQHHHHHPDLRLCHRRRTLSLSNHKCRLNATPRRLRPGRTFTLSSGLPPLTLTLMDDGWTEVRGWATPWAVGRARVNRSSLPILFLAAKSSQDCCRVNLSV